MLALEEVSSWSEKKVKGGKGMGLFGQKKKRRRNGFWKDFMWSDLVGGFGGSGKVEFAKKEPK